MTKNILYREVAHELSLAYYCRAGFACTDHYQALHLQIICK